MTRAVRAIVRGTVQGVGFRAFAVREAERLGLDGWVRNRRDGTVEAVLSGDAAAVDRMLMALGVGPPGASVVNVRSMAHAEPVAPGFSALPTE